MPQTVLRKGPRKSYHSSERSRFGVSVQLRGKSELGFTPLDPNRPMREYFRITDIDGCVLTVLSNAKSSGMKMFLISITRRLLKDICYTIEEAGPLTIIHSKSDWECNQEADGLEHKLTGLCVIYCFRGTWDLGAHCHGEIEVLGDACIDAFTQTIYSLYPELHEDLSRYIMKDGLMGKWIDLILDPVLKYKGPMLEGMEWILNEFQNVTKTYNWTGKDAKTGKPVLNEEIMRGLMVQYYRWAMWRKTTGLGTWDHPFPMWPEFVMMYTVEGRRLQQMMFRIPPNLFINALTKTEGKKSEIEK